MPTTMHHEVHISVSKQSTWSAIADDFGEVYKYSPNITHSRLIGKTRNAVGMTRRCDFPGNQYIVEKITTWNEGASFTFNATEISLPMKMFRSRWTLEGDDSHSVLRVETAWEPKGLLGNLMRPLMKRRLTRGLGQALDDMRKELEKRASSQEPSPPPLGGQAQPA